MVRFGLIGAGGYVAPRHMKAIKETNNDLVTILDPNDSIGVIDSYFPNASYFSEYDFGSIKLFFKREILEKIEFGLYISLSSLWS